MARAPSRGGGNAQNQKGLLMSPLRQSIKVNPLLHWTSYRPSTMSDSAQPRFGFVNFAETWNGRLAMLGFVIGLGTELLTGQGILTQIGLG